MDRIDNITLQGALPEVFRGLEPLASQIWLTELKLGRPNFYVIAAESGTGKSSMCAYLYGNRRDYLGEILFNGDDIRKYSIDEWQEIRRRHIAYLPQELSLFPELTALENIQLKNKLTGHASEERIEEWLHELGIDSRTHFPVGKMSIGQQQRVGIIRAICQTFDFLLLDEPVSHLDEENNKIAAGIIAREAQRQQASVIATSVGNNLLLSEYEMLNL
ncbi:MAG: ATP-binding cassette domain-containing protein [Muribaculaceae bacterium]|nr:ATP-binding cassette domain-containing protein [Muribaculaceae bacterium]